MEQLFNWIRNVSYDLLAILFPGAIFGSAIYGILISLPITGELFRFPELDLTSNNRFELFLAITISYLLGMLLKEFGSLKFVAKFYSLHRKSYSSESLYRTALARVMLRYNLTQELTWQEFYLIVKHEVMTSNSPTLIVSYQNRYELYRSLSIASAILAVLQSIIAVVTHCVLDTNLSHYQTSLQVAIIVLSLAATKLFKSGYLKFWSAFGDHVISHAMTYNKPIAGSVKNDEK